MAIRTVLFDLDGTLLPMDQDLFVKRYFELLCQKMAPWGYDPQQLVNAVWAGTKAMIANDGSDSNENVFWRIFSASTNTQLKADADTFEAFYCNEFNGVAEIVQKNDAAPKLIGWLHEQGIQTVLATNPVFPRCAVDQRLRWNNLQPSDFSLITSYENQMYCKPNPNYFAAIADRLELDARECIMVGNDVEDDMAAAALGMKVFLLTDFCVNTHKKDITSYPNGDFEALKQWLEKEIGSC